MKSTRITQFIFVLLTLLLSSVIYGQESFQNGYIIDNQSDTIKGFLKEQFNETDYDVWFKQTEDGEVEIKTPESIQKYYMDFGHLYETHEIAHEGNSTKLFLKCLIIGETSLYGFTDNKLKKYYYVRNDELGFRELKYGKEIIKDEKKGSYMKTHNRYIGILKLVTADCPDLVPQIDKLKFSERGVMQVLRDYHYCINKDFIEMTSAEKRKGKFGLSFFGGPNFILNSREDLDIISGKTGLDLGWNVEYIIPNSRNRYSLKAGYLLSMYYVEENSSGNVYRGIVHQIPVSVNTYFGDEKNRYSIKVGYYFDVLRTSFVGGNSLAAGIGYDKKIGKIRLGASAEYRFGRLRTLGVHLRVGF